MKLLFAGARSATVLLVKAGDYFMPAPLSLYLNGAPLGEERRSVVSLFDLEPETDYDLTYEGQNGERARLSFRTEAETYTLDVRRFGAKGDGETDDTPALQAAILSCPAGGRVVLDPGTYVSGPLFLKSHMTLELRRGATLALCTDESRFPILPGVIFPTGEGKDLLLGTHEGNPLDARAAALTGIEVEDVRIIGEGIVDGRAREAGWWINTKERYGTYRPSLLLLERCRNVTVQGVTFRNSPFWNIHPLFSQDLSFLNILVEAPAVSPNTDGFDPESCRSVRLMGAVLSVGDDCIALKSGKIWQGRTLKMPCEDIEIAYCAMLDGHGGVTVGSEMAGGVRRVRVHHCWMRGNDRGLRIKSRRGRGKQAVIDDIRFEDIRMEGVKMPLVVNCMYFCDPDGHAPFVQSREPQPVDDGTPTIGSIIFRRVKGTGCEACVGYLLGLPERPVESLTVQDCAFSFRENASALVPAMADGVPAVHNRGIIAAFIRELNLENVTMEGIEGPPVVRE